jgi:hypothetical protein
MMMQWDIRACIVCGGDACITLIHIVLIGAERGVEAGRNKE